MNPHLVLQAAHGLGLSAQHRIITYVREHGLTLTDFINLSATDQEAAALSRSQAASLREAVSLAERWQDDLERSSVSVVGYLDDGYPQRLRIRGQKAPSVLCLRGNRQLLGRDSIGFCGSRDTTPRGLEVVSEITQQLVLENCLVISGHARGTDTAAHVAALRTGGATIIVAPEGILNFRLRAELADIVDDTNTLVLSQFAPSAPWSIANAMARNRTISDLSNALVVIDSGDTGGTFEAGKYALKHNQLLYVANYDYPAEGTPGNAYFLARGGRPLYTNGATAQPNTDEIVRAVRQGEQSGSDSGSAPLQPRLL